MPMSLELTTTIQAPPERVFEAATDTDHFQDWMQNFVRVEVLTEGPFANGTQFLEYRKMFGKVAFEHFEVVHYEPPTRLDLFVDGTKGATKRGVYHFVHTFEPLDGGQATLLRLVGNIEGMGIMGAILGVFFKGMFRKAMQKDFDALKAWIESTA